MSILLATEQKAQDRIWEHFQNEGAESFQQSSGRLRFLVNLIPRGSRVLDVGVGAGVFESLALQRGLDVFCLDPSERSIRALQSKLGLGEQAQVGYSQDMPFANESFDYVVMSEVLEHLSDQVVTDTVTEVHRVLVPGGRMLGTVPSRESLDEQQVLAILAQAEFKQSIVDAMTRPAEAKPWFEYRRIFLTDKRINGRYATRPLCADSTLEHER